MEKRVVFRSPWLPYALVRRSRGHAACSSSGRRRRRCYSRCCCRTRSASKIEFVWFDNFGNLFQDPHYLASFKITAMFSVLVAVTRPRALAAAGRVRRPRDARRERLQDAADLALRGGAGGRRRALAVHVRPVDRHASPTRCAASASTGTTCSTATRRCC